MVKIERREPKIVFWRTRAERRKKEEGWEKSPHFIIGALLVLLARGGGYSVWFRPAVQRAAPSPMHHYSTEEGIQCERGFSSIIDLKIGSMIDRDQVQAEEEGRGDFFCR